MAIIILGAFPARAAPELDAYGEQRAVAMKLLQRRIDEIQRQQELETFRRWVEHYTDRLEQRLRHLEIQIEHLQRRKKRR